MSDDKKTIDFKSAKNKNLKQLIDRQRQNEGIIRSMGKVTPPPPPPPKKQEGKVIDKLDQARGQREAEMAKEIASLRRKLESEAYMARVLNVAHDIFVRSQPHLLRNEEERLALAESSVQAGQAFYKIAKEFIEYVSTEDFINEIMKEPL